MDGQGFIRDVLPDVVPTAPTAVAVYRALVEANDGRIWLRRRRGGGTEVGFSLPLYDLAAER